MPKKKNTPFFGGGLLADGFKKDTSGKYTATGVFTEVWAWDFPCERNFAVIVTIYELPKSTISLLISIRRKYSTDSKVIASASLESEVDNNHVVIPIPLQLKFERPGNMQIECSFKEHKNKLIIPFRIKKKDWPEFTSKEISFVKKHKNIPNRTTVTVQCKSCKYNYIFVDSIINDTKEFTKGAYKFPESGVFECKECGQIINLRDLQGRMRASLKTLINEVMGR